jgi:hypothetical protein
MEAWSRQPEAQLQVEADHIAHLFGEEGIGGEL